MTSMAQEPESAEAVELMMALSSLDDLDVVAGEPSVVSIGDDRALKLEGLVLVQDMDLEDLGIEVEIFAEGPCYPGVVFRWSSLSSYELAYAVPQVSGQSDAIQYDPVFNGSNTWQLHSGPFFQARAEVPTGQWFRFRLDVVGQRAVIQVDDQDPLVVEHLSHDTRQGRVGLWAYRPAFFRNLRIGSPRDIDEQCGVAPEAPSDVITEWTLLGYGPVKCDGSGILNVNRYLDASHKEATLVRKFEVSKPTTIEMHLGYSDSLTLEIDGETVATGSHTFAGFADRATRGWVEPDTEKIRRRVESGTHELTARLLISEPFGWGLVVRLRGEDLRLLPLTG